MHRTKRKDSARSCGLRLMGLSFSTSPATLRRLLALLPCHLVLLLDITLLITHSARLAFTGHELGGLYWGRT